MKPNTILIVLLTFMFVLYANDVFSQSIGWTKSKIIEEEGYDYETGTNEDSMEYISYYVSKERYTRVKIYYFQENGDNEEICSHIRLIEPLSEINEWIKTFKKEYVKIGKLKWKDYATELIIKIDKEDDVCIVNWYMDSYSE